VVALAEADIVEALEALEPTGGAQEIADIIPHNLLMVVMEEILYTAAANLAERVVQPPTVIMEIMVSKLGPIQVNRHQVEAEAEAAEMAVTVLTVLQAVTALYAR
jgi:hypothetical protein